jgi:hypothetical protein
VALCVSEQRIEVVILDNRTSTDRASESASLTNGSFRGCVNTPVQTELILCHWVTVSNKRIARRMGQPPPTARSTAKRPVNFA